jgi:hypothetical protein
MRIIKLLGLAFMATLAFGAVAATNSFAAEELFLTASGHELLFEGLSLLGLLRGLNGGIPSIVSCELDLVHGWALNDSPLAHRIKILFHTKCQQTVGSTTEKCTEPIHVKESLGELGLLLLPNGKHDIVLLLIPSDGTTVFAKITCGSFGETTVEGAVIGELPETVNGVNQYNKPLTEFLLIFESENKNENQRYTTLDLLGVVMPGPIGLKVAGFLGGKASEEDTVHLRFDGLVEICIHP